MNDYEIFNFEEDINKNYIFLNNIDDLYFFTEDIYNELSKTQGNKFSVIVDLFLRNGYSFNRYVLLNFEEGSYNSIIINPNDVSESSKKTVKQYLKEHVDILNNGTSTKSTINYVLNN